MKRANDDQPESEAPSKRGRGEDDVAAADDAAPEQDAAAAAAAAGATDDKDGSAGPSRRKQNKRAYLDNKKNRKLRQQKERAAKKAEEGIPADPAQRAEYHRHQPIEMTNARFEAFYKGLSQIIPENEWDAFMETIRKPLPTSFRITGNSKKAAEMKRLLHQFYFPSIETVEIAGERVSRPECLSFYPDERAYQLDTSRKIFRSHPALSAFHKFLTVEVEMGNFCRQEAVSMIPPLFLDVQPHHKVLDMCAAPGSKTGQLVEMLHQNDELMPSGFVVANDANYKRCYLLIHQTKRLCSPSLLVTNLDASLFPTILPGNRQPPVLFDRILCDAPCSGDGTMRKNLDVWKNWRPSSGSNMHRLQIRILRRAVQLLEIGGMMVYSTCSMHPGENEAVVAAILQQMPGALELVDVSDKLPGLKRIPGLHTWKLMDGEGNWYSDASEVPVGHKEKRALRGSLFPPPPEVAAALHLERCVRVTPQLQNTGGFFIALLRKTSSVVKFFATPGGRPARSAPSDAKADEAVGEVIPEDAVPIVGEDEEDEAEDAADKAAAAAAVAGDNADDDDAAAPADDQKEVAMHVETVFPKNTRTEAGYYFLTPEDPVVKLIVDYFDISPEFDVTKLASRSEAGKRTIYLVNDSLKQVMNAVNASKLNLIMSGVKLFEKASSTNGRFPYRVTNDGVQLILPYLRKRVVHMTYPDVLVIAKGDRTPFFDRMAPSTREQLQALAAVEQGAGVLVFDPQLNPHPDNTEIVERVCISTWIGKVSLNVMVSKEDMASLKNLIVVPDLAALSATAATTDSTASSEAAPMDVVAE
ncbi:tRNA (cytosine-5-)-methyltransferase NSUN2 [Capsaspora owczarzaki ATCC 30864]|uniref:tRNA (cytosine-5-)-methyltransferase NSUN2 n=1 Tax=Capsaspora owczarzaki (strain ATCC 30864) TaxID=595528 RepID=UPI000352060A|nr:tRNA (cytosine-5-)-methyltransferase NSUN2 [Capsaspora owczarzaki ATCC 30864]|eukprot:XP_004363856.2 tRNA (cytosine-5-)-methyltransferase NSUN2 [Capsaspora owczarzaki ATCC 30864]